MKPRENYVAVFEHDDHCMTSCWLSGLYFNMVWIDEDTYDSGEGICTWCFYDEDGKLIGFGDHRAF